MFITDLETLANKIRKDKYTKGIKIDKKKIKISLLADAITLILSDINSVQNSFKILKSFSKCAGLKINVHKTQRKYIRSLISFDHFPHGLSWIKTPIETLGIVITDNDETNYKYNFQQKMFTLKSTLRKLSLKGKIIVLNNLALTPIICVSSVVNTPNKAIMEKNNTIQNFIWEGSTSKITQKTLFQQIEKGGLKLCHFEMKVKVLKLSWVKRLTSDNESIWKILPKFFFQCHNLEIYFKANNPLPTKQQILTFYLEIHNLFMKFFKKRTREFRFLMNLYG